MASVKECFETINELRRVIERLDKQMSVSQENVAIFRGNVERLRDQSEPALRDVPRLQRDVDELRPLLVQLAIAQADIAAIKKAGDVWGARIWTVVVAVVGGVFGYYLKR